jgi:uncharacterized FAD-dependent dehydrogenase
MMTAKKSPFQQDLMTMMADNMALMADNTALPQLIAEHTDGMLKAQAEFLDGFEKLTREFLDRRRVDNETAIKAAQKISGCGDVNEMLVAYFDWLGGTVRRLTDDTTAMSEKAFAVAASAAKAGQNGAATDKAKSKPAKRKAKPKRKAETKPHPVAQQVAAIQKQRLAG